MNELIQRGWDELIGRADGPLTLRLFLQPAMAAFFAIRSGMKDARLGRPAYLWSIVHDPTSRRAMLHEGWKDVSKVFVAAVVLDGIYQVIAIHRIRPIQLVLVPFVLALLPYAALRGPVSRIAKHFRKGAVAS